MSDAKLLRKQLRNVTQELLPEIMKSELGAAIQAVLQKDIDARLTAIENHIKSVLDKVDNRSKDINTLILRQMSAPAKKE